MTTITQKNLRGFTLIEVMVVMAIISIVSGMVIVSLTDSRVKRELETNAREFVGVVREAQNYALTGKQIGGNTACSFSVTWMAPSTYNLKYTPSGNCTATPTSTASYSLKNGVIFQNASTSGSFNFALPHANFSGNTSVKFTKKGIWHTVCISSDGRISDKPGPSCP